MTDKTQRPDIEGFLALEKQTSLGPWDGPHLSDDSTTCNCTSIVNGGYAGAIAYVGVDNGIVSIGEGGNDCPPLEEAKANGRLLLAAKNTAPAIAKYALALEKELEKYKKLDREAATYCETVICMRTGFTGDPPYVGWKGLGLALTEALDERDELLAENELITASHRTLSEERDNLSQECERYKMERDKLAMIYERDMAISGKKLTKARIKAKDKSL